MRHDQKTRKKDPHGHRHEPEPCKLGADGKAVLEDKDTLTITLYAKLLRKKMDEGKITEESAIRAGAMAASELWLKEANYG